MKKLVVAMILLGVVFFPLCANAEIEIIEERQHKQWASFVLLDAEDSYARMMTEEADGMGNTFLTISAYPGTCGSPRLQIIYCGKETLAGKDDTFQATGSLRVDERSIFDLDFLVTVDNSCMIFGVQTEPTILKDLMGGRFVRLKINYLESTKSIFKRYSLLGFTAAYQRTSTMCQEIQAIFNEKNDSEYFKEQLVPVPEATPPVQTRYPKKDSDFFL